MTFWGIFLHSQVQLPPKRKYVPLTIMGLRGSWGFSLATNFFSAGMMSVGSLIRNFDVACCERTDDCLAEMVLTLGP